MNGVRLKNKRKELKISGQEIADALGTTRTTVYRWEAGLSEPNDSTKVELAKMLNTSVAYLMDETDNPKPENRPENFAYWGEMLDRAQKVIKRGDSKEISVIGNIIRTACELFTPESENDNSRININATNNFGSRQVVVSA